MSNDNKELISFSEGKGPNDENKIIEYNAFGNEEIDKNIEYYEKFYD